MVRMTLTPEGRAAVAAAVGAAEGGTNGEIVTVVARRSDRYNDVPWHYAVLAILLVAALATVDPGWLAVFGDGWTAPPLPQQLLVLMAAQIAAFLLVRYVVGLPAVRLAFTPRATRRSLT